MKLDTVTAAKAAKVTPRTIRRWVAQGDLRNYGTGTRIRVDPVQLRVLIEGHGLRHARRAAGHT